MTDGILLAETQTDPLLKAYDTLIIDEAHERSLNIDFLLGYLRQILPRRPDLKVIVTSATIDADRFAKHFADASACRAGGARASPPARVGAIMVSGRTFPVEQRYRPFEETGFGRKRIATLNVDAIDADRPKWTSCGSGRAGRVGQRRGRHPGLPARRARNPRSGRPPAQAPVAPAR
jgi:HrpA-like RNA helicase